MHQWGCVVLALAACGAAPKPAPSPIGNAPPAVTTPAPQVDYDWLPDIPLIIVRGRLTPEGRAVLQERWQATEAAPLPKCEAELLRRASDLIKIQESVTTTTIVFASETDVSPIELADCIGANGARIDERSQARVVFTMDNQVVEVVRRGKWLIGSNDRELLAKYLVPHTKRAEIVKAIKARDNAAAGWVVTSVDLTNGEFGGPMRSAVADIVLDKGKYALKGSASFDDAKTATTFVAQLATYGFDQNIAQGSEVTLTLNIDSVAPMLMPFFVHQ